MKTSVEIRSHLPRTGCRWWSRMLALGALSLTSGCIVLPTPHIDSGETRTNICEQTANRFAVGAATRADVLLALGEPDAVTPDESRFAFRREKIVGVWFVGGYGSAAGGSIDADRYFVTEFDAGGTLIKATYDSCCVGSTAPEKLVKIAAAEMNRDASIRLQARANWLAGARNYRSPGYQNPTWISGRLVLTESELRFFSRVGLANEPALLTLPYMNIKSVTLERFVFTKFLYVDEQSGRNHAFQIWGGLENGHARQTRDDAFEFIRNKINPSAP